MKTTMKSIVLAIISAIVLVISSCSGSDVYRGIWKAVNSEGEKYELNFSETNLVVTDSLGESKDYGYKQFSVEISNGIRNYGIELSDGRSYNIIFPIPEDGSTAVIQGSNEQLLYTLGREKYVSFEEIYGL